MNHMLTEDELRIQDEKARLVAVIQNMSDEEFTRWSGHLSNTVEVLEYDVVEDADVVDDLLAVGYYFVDQGGQLQLMAD